MTDNSTMTRGQAPEGQNYSQLQHSDAKLSEKFALLDRRSAESSVSGASKFAFSRLLLKFHNVRNDICCPSYETLGASMGVSGRSAKTLVSNLVAAGWIEIERRGRSTNNYRIVGLSRAGEEPRQHERPNLRLVASNETETDNNGEGSFTPSEDVEVKETSPQKGRNLHHRSEGNFTAGVKETRPHNNLSNSRDEQLNQTSCFSSSDYAEKRKSFPSGLTGIPLGLADRNHPDWHREWRSVFIDIAGQFDIKDQAALIACHDEFVDHYKASGKLSADWKANIRTWCRKRRDIAASKTSPIAIGKPGSMASRRRSAI